MSGFVPGTKRLLQTVSLLTLLSACAVTPNPLTPEQSAKQGADDRATMFKESEPLNGPLSLSEAIARSLKYNLDHRTKMMEEALALDQTELDRFDLLPKVTANTTYNGRSKTNASRSGDYVTGALSNSNPTYSADRNSLTADLGVSWNILDFGVSYFTAHQNADRALIATERRRKTIQNLVSEVRFAFWRAAAYQVLKDDVDNAVVEAAQALEKVKTVERENLKTPVEFLRYQKSLLETMRQLTAIQQELSTAQIELAALVNLPPGAEITLVVPEKMKVPTWNINLDRMEELAFLNNPDLHEQGYLTRIAVDDTRKAIIKLFPGVTFTGSRNYDQNSFLINHRWYEAGAKLSWNLISLVSGPASIKYAKASEQVANDRRVALGMAVLAQVHVSELQFRSAISQYLQSDELWRVDKRLSDLSDAKTANDAQGILERVAGRSSAIASQLRRFQTYSQLEKSFARMQETLGQDLLPNQVDDTDLNGLSKIVAERIASLDKGKIDEPALPPTAPVQQPQPVAAAPQPAPQASQEPKNEWLQTLSSWVKMSLDPSDKLSVPEPSDASPEKKLDAPKMSALPPTMPNPDLAMALDEPDRVSLSGARSGK